MQLRAQANVTPSTVARNAKTPLATRRSASDDLEELELELAEDADVAVGVDDATASTPPVTGPLSVTYYASHKERHLNTCSITDGERPTVFSLEPMAFAAAKKAAPVFPVLGALIELTGFVSTWQMF